MGAARRVVVELPTPVRQLVALITEHTPLDVLAEDIQCRMVQIDCCTLVIDVACLINFMDQEGT